MPQNVEQNPIAIDNVIGCGIDAYVIKIRIETLVTYNLPLDINISINMIYLVK